MAERRYGKNQTESETFDIYPPFSRLFIICNKQHTENEFRETFSKYGSIEDIWLVKDRVSGDNKGVAYIKFSKTTEAAIALEEMNGKTLGNCTRPIKVMVASSKHEGPVRDNNDDEKYVRLFVMIPRAMKESELNDEFSKYGKVESVTIIRDKETRESKAYGYVRYKNFSEAAKAYENSDKKFKAIFAEPKRSKSGYDPSNFDSFSRMPPLLQPTTSTFASYSGSNSEAYTRLNVICSPLCQQDQIWKLFDIIPGLDYCHYKIDGRRHMGVAQVVYTSHQSAKYAREKLHGFEYPPGIKLIVKPEYEVNGPNSPYGSQSPSDLSTMTANIKAALVPGVQNSDLAQLAETIAQATSLIQAAAAGSFSQRPSVSDDSFCNVKLPPPMPLAEIDAPVAQRCFLVCQPQPPPIAMLRDAFSRFGDLIDVYTLPYKNVGYVKYASIRSAQEARKTLHGSEICGIRMKVLEAEERFSGQRNTIENTQNSAPNISSENNDDRRKRLKIEN